MEIPSRPAYPATLSIDYPDRPLDRLTSAFRIITVIPIMIVLGALTGRGQNAGTTTLHTERSKRLLIASPLLPESCSFPRC